jgi:hypothetical protein
MLRDERTLMTHPIFAYLDPGTGATLAQLALAGTAGIAAAFKLRVNKVKRRVGKTEDEQHEAPDTNQDEESITRQ